MKVVVVIPTYKERENIRRLIPALSKEFNEFPKHRFQILVVDDNSPDGTADVVKQFELTDGKSVLLLTGKKQGLGAAYIRGFKHAIKKLKASLVVEMDADFSHRPEDLSKLIAEIGKGSEFVIGSRYVKGGKVPKNWNIIRKLNSKWGNRFARYLAGIDGIQDCTSGFRAIKKDILQKIDLDDLKVRGYSFQMNLLYKAYVNGAKIKEVPIIFKEREWGRTKIGPTDVLEFIWNSIKLRFEMGLEGLDKRALRKKNKRAISYAKRAVSYSKRNLS